MECSIILQETLDISSELLESSSGKLDLEKDLNMNRVENFSHQLSLRAERSIVPYEGGCNAHWWGHNLVFQMINVVNVWSHNECVFHLSTMWGLFVRTRISCTSGPLWRILNMDISRMELSFSSATVKHCCRLDTLYFLIQGKNFASTKFLLYGIVYSVLEEKEACTILCSSSKLRESPFLPLFGSTVIRKNCKGFLSLISSHINLMSNLNYAFFWRE